MITLKPHRINRTDVCIPCRASVRVSRHGRNDRLCACGQPYLSLGDVRVPKRRDDKGWATLAEIARQRLSLGGRHITYLRNIGQREFGIAAGPLNSPASAREYGEINRRRRSGLRGILSATPEDARQQAKNDRLRRRLTP